MKRYLPLLPVMILLFIFTGCANGKQLQEEPPKAVQQAYYTTWTGGVKAAGSGVNLFVPVDKDAEISLDTVYFRGRKGVLEKVASEEGLYVARFKTQNDQREVVMHVDPKMEYGNPAPEILEPIPFELEADEAVVRYTRKGKEKYFRIKGIQKRETGEVKLKDPKNIRH